MALSVATITDAISQVREKIALERGEIELVKKERDKEVAKIKEQIAEANRLGQTQKAALLKPLIAQAVQDARAEIGELKEFIEEHNEEIRHLQSELRRASKREARLN